MRRSLVISGALRILLVKLSWATVSNVYSIEGAIFSRFLFSQTASCKTSRTGRASTLRTSAMAAIR